MSEPLPLRPWYRELTGYHWFVLIVCTLGWLFDCFDQQLFIIARQPAISELCGIPETHPDVNTYTTRATSVLMIGWATGGILFGILGDRIGRARTMFWTILSYSVFTGLSGFSQTIYDFMFYRFMAGLGVGGQFAVGASLVAEVMPDRARVPALGMLQALSAVGNVSAAMVGLGFGYFELTGALPYDAWRWMFAVGIVPALLAVVVIARLREPERWKQAVAEGVGRKKAGSLKEMFGHPEWRRRAIVGMVLGSAGIIGLWAIGFYSIDLNRSVFRRQVEERARQQGEGEADRHFVRLAIDSPQRLDELSRILQPEYLLSQDPENRDPQALYGAAVALHSQERAVSRKTVLDAVQLPDKQGIRPSADDNQRRAEYLEGGALATTSLSEHADRILTRQKQFKWESNKWGSITSMLFNIGAFFGIYAFSRVTQRVGRRPTFAMFFVAVALVQAIAFLLMNRPSDVFWMVPLTGFFQLSVFGGYAIYFPELFPTRLRSTGTSLCYNIARYVAATGPLLLGLLTAQVFTGPNALRYAGVTMCSVFLIGLVVLPFAPETKDQPLPE
jgi:MFS family permease